MATATPTEPALDELAYFRLDIKDAKRAMVVLSSVADRLRNLVEITIADGEVRLRCCDLDQDVTCTLENKVASRDCVVRCDLKQLAKAIRSSKRDISASIDSNVLTLHGDVETYHELSSDLVGCVDADIALTRIRIPSQNLRDHVKRASVACGMDSMRYALYGVCFDVAGDSLRLAATDIRRLAIEPVNSASFIDCETEHYQSIVPLSTCKTLIKAIDKRECDVIAELGKDHIAQFTIGDWCTITTRVVEGRFPNYLDVVPDCEYSVSCDAKHWQQMSKAWKLNKAKFIELVFEYSDLTMNGCCKVDQLDSDQCKLHGQSDFPIVYWGEKRRITLDASFIADFINLQESGSFVFRFSGNTDPVMLTGYGEQVIMPLGQAY